MVVWRAGGAGGGTDEERGLACAVRGVEDAAVMRVIFALFMGLMGLGLAGLYAEALTGREPLVPLAHFHYLLNIVLAVLTSGYFFRPSAAWQGDLRCPACGERGALELSEVLRPRPSAAVLFFGGFFLMLLFQHWRPSGFRCRACGAKSAQRPVGSWLAVSWGVGLVAMLLASMFAA